MNLKWTFLYVVYNLCVNYGYTQDDRTDSPFVWKSSRLAMPWLKGPNVCAVEEVQGTGRRYYTECMPGLQRNICQRDTFIRYHCCTGFEEAGDGSSGCRGVAPVRPILSSFNHLTLRETGEYMSAALGDLLREAGPFTVFAPDRTALQEASREVRNLLRTRDETENLLRLHVAEGRHFTETLSNNQELPTLFYDEESGIVKINRYTNGVLTANCARISLPDQVASNGVIHIMEEVMRPYKHGQSVMDALMEDQRFTELVTYLIFSKAVDDLRNLEASSVTIFAPTDDAFRRAPPELIQRLFEEESKETMKRLMKYHVTDHSLCSAAILGPASYVSQEGQLLNLSCDANNRFLVNGVPATRTDIMAQNGVIHEIDELLIPDSVKTVEDLLLDMDLGQFQEFAQQAGMSDILSGKTPGNYTYFVPNAEAFNALSPQQRNRIQTDSAIVRKVFRYHAVPETVYTEDLTDGATLPTLSGPPVRCNIYQKAYGVNSAKITNPNNRAGNGVIHVIDRVLFPPEETAIEIIKSNPDLSTFASLLESSGLDRRLDRSGHHTILAPTNDAFDRLPKALTERLLLNDEELRKALSYHILKKPIFSTSMNEGLRYRSHSLTEDYVHMEKPEGRNDVIVNDRARVLIPDIESTSGVIHTVDSVLECPCVRGFQNING